MAHFARRAARLSRPHRLGALKPVALAVLAVLSGTVGSPGLAAGSVLNLRPTVRAAAAMGPRPLPLAIPDPVTSFNNGSGHQQNIATQGAGTGVVTHANQGKPNETITLDISQSTPRAIYLWNSYNIGDQATVNYIFQDANGAALNRVPNSMGPSLINGRLNARYRDPATGQLVKGGELFLLNRNGILFGSNAQVDVGGLLASALDMRDADFMAGMNNSINGLSATFFKWVDPVTGAATYDPEENYVKVEQGAEITTASGGRVFLLGGKVENAGTITTPSGQTVLAAGSEVFLSNPTGPSAPIYMSEANELVPTVKGLLVEVNGSMKAGESATNSGTINTPTGNATIVGWAVNQTGRISATTSTTQNGSVYLLARSGAKAVSNGDNNPVPIKRATQGGSLVIGDGVTPGSGVIEITPDADSPKRALSEKVTASRIELSGNTIEFKDKARITAPGAQVNVRAEEQPVYEVYKALEKGNGAVKQSGARVTLAAGATIDVSGTTNTEESVARHFVTIPLVTKSDLKDAPLQKDGPLYRSKVTFDTRESSAILADTTSYAMSAQAGASEFMSKGGAVLLSANGGAVVTHQSSLLDISGGSVTYTADRVFPSVLVAENGQHYTLNSGPADVRYVGVVGKDETASRFGPIAGATTAGLGHVEAGYVDGRAAGSLTVLAPTVVLDGKVLATTVKGQRQRAGKDRSADLGRLALGLATRRTGGNEADVSTFGSAQFDTAVVNDLRITAAGQSQGDNFWQSPTRAVVPTESRISAQNLNQSGLGNISIAADGHVVVDGALSLPDLASLAIKAGGDDGLTLGASIHSAGGTVDVLTAKANGASSRKNGQGLGTLTVNAGVTIDVSGNWVNQRLDGADLAGAAAGGKVSLVSGNGLVMGQGSAIDVSGGATLTASGAIKGTSAGAITLVGNNQVSSANAPLDEVRLAGASLAGYGLAKGASLTIKTGEVDIVPGGAGAPAARQGEGAAALTLSADFFTQGGFQDYNIEGMRRLTVAPGVLVAPRLATWTPTAALRRASSGATLARLMRAEQQVDGARPAANLTLASGGVSTDLRTGVLTLSKDAQILGDPKSRVTLTAGSALLVDGGIKAAGGQADLSLSRAAAQPFTGQFKLGATASVDVSGVAVLKPDTGALKSGEVLDGGTIALSVKGATSATPIELQRDDLLQRAALLKANGTQEALDIVRPLGGSGPRVSRQTVASNGGAININAGTGGAVLAGEMQAHGGNAAASGGFFSLDMGTVSANSRINVQNAAVLSNAVVAGNATVSAAQLKAAGFADAYLKSRDEIRFVANTDLALPRHVRLDAPTVSAEGKAKVTVSAGSTTQMGSTVKASERRADSLVASSGKGVLTLEGNLVELYGQQALKGIGTFNATSATELRLRGVDDGDKVLKGALLTQADVNLKAQQVVVATATDYKLDAPGKVVTISGGNRQARVPLSAGGALAINAAKIVQQGVLRAPFGRITLNATDAITLGDDRADGGSLTSVSGDGLLVPYGSTTGGGTTWTYLDSNQVVAAPADKAIVLNADGKAVTIKANATVDLSGGGDLVAWEFVPGSGGSQDIFQGALNGAFAVVPTIDGYAPHDQAILNLGGQSLDPGKGNTLGLGSQITFGANGPLAAGTYAVLPARYALLPGAYLVKPSGSATSVATGFSQLQADGSYLVGARLGTAGTPEASNARPSGFVVMPSEVARRYSEIRDTHADSFFAAKAERDGVATPRLSADAGRLAVLADQLLMGGKVVFGHPAAGRGGQLDIASKQIHVGGVAQSGALNLSFAQLNATGADSIVLGGIRQRAAADGSVAVVVSANQVVVDAEPSVLKTGDLTLAATGTVSLSDEVSIEANGQAGTAASLSFTGNGALLRVSGDEQASTTRSLANVKDVGQNGDLLIGQNVSLKGGTLVAEATRTNQIAGQAGSKAKLSASKITVGAQRILAGDVPANAASPAAGPALAKPLVLSAALAADLNKARDVTLRAFSGLDLYKNTVAGSQANVPVLGGDQTRSLTIDTAKLEVHGGETAATIKAGGVQIKNTTGVQPVAAVAGNGNLKVEATGQAGGTGHVVIGDGTVGISGVNKTDVVAAGSIVLAGMGGVQTKGDLSLAAQSLTARQAAVSTLSTDGVFTLTSPSATPGANAAQAGAGARVTVSASQINQQGVIALPSGVLDLRAQNDIAFKAPSVTNLSGLKQTIDGVALSSMGGTLTATSERGSIAQQQGARIDVSAGSGGGTAGSMAFRAPSGGVDLKGTLLATSTAAQTGGSLSIDSGQAVDLNALAKVLASQDAALNNFGESIKVRARQQGQNLTLASGSTLKASNIELASDLGNVTVAGQLKATSSTGGTITLAAGHDVELVGDGALLAAHADAQNKSRGTTGGLVQLMSSGLADDSTGELGRIRLSGGTIDTGGLNGGVDGRLTLRNTLEAWEQSQPLKTTLLGVQSVQLEAFKVYEASDIDMGLVSTVSADAINFSQARADGQSSARVLADRLAAGNAALANKLQVRYGAEIRSATDLTLKDQDLNLMSWRATAQDGSPMAPVNLTLRAADNLIVQRSISDGLLSFDLNAASVARTDLIQPGDGATIRLVGGSDTTGANVLATTVSPAKGDVVIGGEDGATDVIVRTTTGDIQIAAGRDVKLTDPLATVYTTGSTVEVPNGYALPEDNRYDNYFIPGSTSPFMKGGGSVSVSAMRDVVALSDADHTATPQFGTDWWWRTKNDDGALFMWNRYELFEQGFATFGGGNVSVMAGRDAWNVGASAQSGGLFADRSAYRIGGGSVSLAANRDITGGFVFAADDVTVRAERSLTQRTSSDINLRADGQANDAQVPGTAPKKLVALYGDGVTSILARNQVDIGLITSAGLLSPIDPTFRSAELQGTELVLGLSPSAALAVASVAGNLNYSASPLPQQRRWANGATNAKPSSLSLLPSTSSFEAAFGALSLGAPDSSVGGTYNVIYQMPVLHGEPGAASPAIFHAFSKGTLTLGGLLQTSSDARAAFPTFVLKDFSWQTQGTSGLIDRPPVRLVSTEGNVEAYGGLGIAQPLRMLAGRDIVQANKVPIQFQHQNDQEVSLIQAGRDVSLYKGDISPGITVKGPGDLVVMAGRAIDLQGTYGIQAEGNRSNSALSAQSARVTVLTGVSFDKGDITSATAAFFPLLGGTGVGRFAPDVYAQIIAARQQQAIPDLGSDEAQRFAALSTQDQIGRVRDLVGEPAYRQRVWSLMRHRHGAAWSEQEAVVQFNALAPAEKAPIVGQLLASLWAATVPQAEQARQAMAMAASLGNPYTDKLVAFLKTRTGERLAAADALKRFAQLPPEQQLLFSEQVLVAEVSAAVSKAAGLTGTAKEAAYLPGYDALEAMFPNASATASNLDMGSSRIKTLQDSSIHVFAPHGGVNVGKLTPASADKPDLGLITAGGGDLNVLVRDDILVNQSRIFTVGHGDELLWASLGNVDAGRGAKTVTATAAPVFYIDPHGNLQVDVASAISGSGIAASGKARIAAPKGEIDAGDAGISAGGGLELAATLIRGADNIQSPSITGAPPPAAVNAALSAPVSTSEPTAAGAKEKTDDDTRKKRKKRNILLDFLGFGDGDSR